MKKQLTLVMCCLTFTVAGMAQPLMRNFSASMQANHHLQNQEILSQMKQVKFPQPLDRETIMQKINHSKKTNETHENPFLSSDPFLSHENTFSSQKQNRNTKSGDWWEPDTIYVLWDEELNGEPYPERRDIFSYNKHFDITTIFYQLLIDGKWENYAFINKEYNDNRCLTFSKLKYWNKYQKKWEDNERTTCTYKNNTTLLTILEEFWDSEQWVNVELTENNWDMQNNWLGEEHLLWRNGKWQKDYKIIVTIKNNNPEEIIFQVGESNEWVNNQRIFCKFENNNCTKELWQLWKSKQWRDTTNWEAKYDNGNNLEEETFQLWNPKNSKLENILKYTYSEYIAPYCNKGLLWQFWDGNSWVNDQKDSLQYNEHYSKTEIIYQKWTGSLWGLSGRLINIFNTDNYLTSSTAQRWKEGEWMDYIKFVYDRTEQNWIYDFFDYEYDYVTGVLRYITNQHYDFDDKGDMREELRRKWENGDWFDLERYIYTYDDNHNAISGYHQRWIDNLWVDTSTLGVTGNRLYMSYNDSESQMVFKDKCFYFRSSYINQNVLSVKENQSHNEMKLYPNPVTSILNIETGNNDLLPEVKIYSVQGALLINTKGTRIDVSSLAPGIYIADINGQCKKIVKH